RLAIFASLNRGTWSKSRTRPAIWLDEVEMSQRSIRRTPDLPVARLSQYSPTERPRGLTVPRPVMTTRFMDTPWLTLRSMESGKREMGNKTFGSFRVARHHDSDSRPFFIVHFPFPISHFPFLFSSVQFLFRNLRN